MTDNPVFQSLDDFVSKLIAMQPEAPSINFDSDWPSACYVEPKIEGDPVTWRPAKQLSLSDMFERLENALEEKIHPDLIRFYSRYWSDPLPATCPDGDLTLIQVWNEEDMERLRENLIGHALSKRQQKRPLTFFIACPEPDDNYLISVDNFSGAVLLETPGKPPIRHLADNLNDFINNLVPRPVKGTEK